VRLQKQEFVKLMGCLSDMLLLDKARKHHLSDSSCCNARLRKPEEARGGDSAFSRASLLARLSKSSVVVERWLDLLMILWW
jgi:hypothetical protein